MANRNYATNILQNIVRVALGICFTIGLALCIFAVMVNTNPGEDRYLGNFETYEIDEWVLVNEEGEREIISLPYTNKDLAGEQVELYATLNDTHLGMELSVHALNSEAYIYIDNTLVETFTKEDLGMNSTQNMPNAYVSIPLNEYPDGTELRIVMNLGNSGKIGTISYAFGNNIWFRIIKENFAIVMAVIFLLIMGLGSIFIYFLSPNHHLTKPLLHLGEAVIMTSVWVFVENPTRQLFFSSLSLTSYIGAILIETSPALFEMYFDAVQDYKHHKMYVSIELLTIIQFMVNSLLYVFADVDFYVTLSLSHLWIALGALVVLGCFIIDFIKHNIQHYRVTSYGAMIFVVACLFELIYYYTDFHYSIGVFVSVGMVLMWATTLIQVTRRLITYQESRNEHVRKMTLKTIETVASAIDAKDEYTGGHSERVAEYSVSIGRAVAAHYHLSEEDMVTLQYVAKMHDIGKIAVPDSILNKDGTLTHDEYLLMKKHVLIGDELLRGIDGLEGLHDGVLYHHERYDGKGYPEGLKGEQIPLIARILCMADCYDAMTSNRVYRKRLSDEEVIAEIRRCAGTQFDPYIAEVCCNLIEAGKLQPSTSDGLATNIVGNAMISSKLEFLLQQNTSLDINIDNPNNIRMAAYLIKTAEMKGEKVDVYLVGANRAEKYGSAKAWDKHYESIKLYISKYIDTYDFMIDYAGHKQLVVFYNHDDKELSKFLSEMVRTTEGSIAPTIEVI